jgi:hypothetical protein
MLHWLTTVLARLKRPRTPAPPLRVGWNGRPLGDAPQGQPSPEQRAPAADYSTLEVFVPRDGSQPSRAAAPPAE